MVSSTAATVEEYLAELPEDRREVVRSVRDLVNAHLPDGYVEGMQYGMISWVVPLERYPTPYNGKPLAVVSLAAQKNAYSLYLMGLYSDPAEAEAFRHRWEATGRRLDMGKSCLRFRRLADLDTDLVAEAVSRVPVDDFVTAAERARGGRHR
jgi:uncharacterized protein YdhG (YjbR/CyaY superfamily)